jgi:hypothetical protein
MMRDPSVDAAYILLYTGSKVLFLAIKPSDLSLISSVSLLSATGFAPAQMRNAGSSLIIVMQGSRSLIYTYDISTNTFSSVFLVSKGIKDVDYSKIAKRITFAYEGESTGIPVISTYAYDYMLSDTSLFTRVGATWTTATSGTHYTYTSGASGITITDKAAAVTDYTSSVTPTSDVTMSTASFSYFKTIKSPISGQSFTIDANITKTIDLSLS